MSPRLLGAGQSDPELLQAFRERFLRPRRQEAYKTLRRGIERGELPENLDLDLVLDILYGAIYMRFLIRHDELSESYVKEVCRLVLGNVSANSRAAGQNHTRRNLLSQARVCDSSIEAIPRNSRITPPIEWRLLSN